MRLADLRATLRLKEVEDGLGIDVVDDSGVEHLAHCPLPTHPGVDANPSFSINVEKLVFKCWTCDYGGSITQLVEAIQGCEKNEALAFLSGFSDYEGDNEDDNFVKMIDGILSRKDSPSIVRNATLPWFPPEVISDYVRQINSARQWLWNRNITDAIIDLYSLGYTDSYSTGPWVYPALVIPAFFGGELRGWQARCLLEERPTDSKGKKLPKYISSPKFPKDGIIYNFDNVDKANPVILVESPLTVCTLASYGYQAVATFGVSIPDSQMKILRTFDAGILACFDNDEAGRVAIGKLATALSNHVPVEIVPPPEGEKADLGDLPKEEVEYQLSLATPSFLL